MMNFYNGYPAALGLAVFILGLGGFAEAVEPPKAKTIPYPLEKHGDVRVDDYYWLH